MQALSLERNEKRGWDKSKIMNYRDEQYETKAKEIYVDSCGMKGLGETPQCDSTRRLISRPRKAKYISVASYMHQL